jgi:LacI family transcriptional regulator
LSTDDLLEVGDFSYASGKAAAAQLLDRSPASTAIVASNDQMALATLEVGRDRSLAVPRDLSLISFDDTPIVRFTHPPLTAVVQRIADVTSRAVELIIADRTGKEVSAEPVVVPAELAIRGSTAGPR